jgi:hypothetical protein
MATLQREPAAEDADHHQGQAGGKKGQRITEKAIQELEGGAAAAGDDRD